MLRAYSDTKQTVLTGANIAIQSNDYNTGYCVAHTPQSGVFTLNVPGIYKIDFYANGTVASTSTTTTTSGNIGVTLLENGEPVNGAVTSAYVASSKDNETVSFSDTIKVIPNTPCNKDNVPMTIAFQNSGLGATWNNVVVNIGKIK